MTAFPQVISRALESTDEIENPPAEGYALGGCIVLGFDAPIAYENSVQLNDAGREIQRRLWYVCARYDLPTMFVEADGARKLAIHLKQVSTSYKHAMPEYISGLSFNMLIREAPANTLEVYRDRAAGVYVITTLHRIDEYEISALKKLAGVRGVDTNVDPLHAGFGVRVAMIPKRKLPLGDIMKLFNCSA